MGILEILLKEELDKEIETTTEGGAFSKEDVAEKESEDTEITEEPIDDDEEEPEIEGDTPQSNLRDLCFEVLSVMESEALVDGESIEEDESVDVCCEIIAKFAEKFPDDVCNEMIKILSEYFEIETDEPVEEEDDYFEEPKEDDGDEFPEDKTTPTPEEKGGAFSK